MSRNQPWTSVRVRSRSISRVRNLPLAALSSRISTRSADHAARAASSSAPARGHLIPSGTYVEQQARHRPEVVRKERAVTLVDFQDPLLHRKVVIPASELDPGARESVVTLDDRGIGRQDDRRMDEVEQIGAVSASKGTHGRRRGKSGAVRRSSPPPSPVRSRDRHCRSGDPRSRAQPGRSLCGWNGSS